MNTVIEQHAGLLQELAVTLHQDATKSDPEWLELYLDFRLDSFECGLGQAIIRTPIGRKGFDLSIEASQIEGDLVYLRDKIPGGLWYGLLIQIDRKGNVDVTYNHDPDCIDTFADDVKSHRPF